MVTKVKERVAHGKAKEDISPRGCAHHWLIEGPHGPTSAGVCRFCGVRKEFFNTIPEAAPPAAKKEKSPLDLPEMEKVSAGGKHDRS